MSESFVLVDHPKCSLCDGPLVFRRGFGRFVSTANITMMTGGASTQGEPQTLALCADCDEMLSQSGNQQETDHA